MKALSYGEVLFDVIGGKEYLGGAPFNLAAHLARCGVETGFISRVGDDDRGRRIMGAMDGLSLSHDWLQVDPEHHTGVVEVEVDDRGQPSYTILEGVAWDYISEPQRSDPSLQEQRWDVFCFGTLVQRHEVSRHTLCSILEQAPAGEIFYDVNLRQDYYQKDWIEKSLGYSTMVKLNDDEAGELSSLLMGEPLELQEFAARLADCWQLKVVLITLGAKGCVIWCDGEFSRIPGIQVEIADTVGAGDAFSAAFLHRFLAGSPAGEAGGAANRLGAYVASKPGAIPEYDDPVRAHLNLV